MTSARILGTARTGTAHPPLREAPPPMTAWLNRPRPTLLDRLMRRSNEGETV